MLKFKQAISPVIASILLLAITVVISVSMFSYLQNYVETTQGKISSFSSKNVEIKEIFTNTLYLNLEQNTTISSMRIIDDLGDVVCEFSEQINVSNEGLMAHYTFDELTFNGTHYLVGDISPNLNTGVLFDDNHSNSDTNTVASLVPSNNGNALKFDGIDDYVEILHHPTISEFANQTIVIKFNLEDLNKYYSTARMIFMKGSIVWGAYSLRTWSVGDGRKFIEPKFYLRNTTSNFGGSDGLQSQKIYSSSDITLIITKNANANCIILSNNNKFEFPCVSGNLAELNTQHLFLGRESSTSGYRPYYGTIDEFRIYNRSFSVQEMESLYWNLNKNVQKEVSSIDISSCNLEKNSRYKIFLVSNGEIISDSIYYR